MRLAVKCRAVVERSRRLAGSSRPTVYVAPVERDEVLRVDRPTAPPPQPVDSRQASPRDLHELRGEEPKGDVHPGCWTTPVGTEGVRRGRSSLTR